VAELAERFDAGDIDLSMTHSKGMAAAVAIVQPRNTGAS
jgi:phosphopantetheinyl transferase (holo-ACP synthase)